MSGSLVPPRGRRRGNRPKFHSARKLLSWSFLTILSITGCILPVAPDFHDPPPAPNYLPYFMSGFPALEEVVTIGDTQSLMVTVADPNPDDTLSIRWVADYPPYVQATSRILQEQVGLGNPATFMLDTRCGAFFRAPTHRLVVLVSDRGFLPSSETPMDYNTQFSFDSSNHPVAVIAGWSLIGCP